MDLSRRAQTPAPIPESRRSTDLYIPITTAAYGTPRTLVIGQQRVPSTILRDGRTAPQTGRNQIPANELGKILYGLSEAPVQSIPIQYGNKDGKKNPGYTQGELAHTTFPLAYVAVTAPGKDESPEDLSFEVSSDINISGNGLGTYIQTGSHQHQVEDGFAAINEDASRMPATYASDFHAVMSGSDATLCRWMVVFDRQSNSIAAYFNALGGQGGDATHVLCDGSTNSALRPAAGAMVQPRVAVVGALVHVVWSVLNNTADPVQPGTPVQIAHIWSADAGATWTAGQSLTLATRQYTTGVWRLGVNVHASGEVWVSFQRRSSWNSEASQNYPSKGVVIGFLPSTATASTAWKTPTLAPSSRYGSVSPVMSTAGELCVFHGVTDGAVVVSSGSPYRMRGPSVLPLGGGKALVAATYMDKNAALKCQLLVLPVIADAVDVHWDLPAGAFATWNDGPVSKNIADISWLATHGFAGQQLDYLPSARYDSLNDASTQIFATGQIDVAGVQRTQIGVLVLSQSRAWNHDAGSGSLEEGAQYNAMGGTWKLPWGYINATGGITWTVPIAIAWKADPAWAAHAFYNGNDQVYIAMGVPDDLKDIGALSYRTRKLSMVMVRPGQSSATQVWTYAPGTALNDSLMYQVWGMNGTALVSIREDEEIDGTFTVGIREIVQFSGVGDVLPSVICQRLVANDLRGLNIPNVVFDPETWGEFDNYCTAMGIKFSLVLTSQQAAWPLACDILESANAMPYRSEGMIKVLVRETAPITANGVTFTPIWNVSDSVVIPPADLRDGIKIDPLAIDASWNSLRVNWKNRARAYADEPYQIENGGSVARKGRIPASAVDWPWICDANVAAKCAWLRLRNQMRTGLKYTFAVSQKYMLLEVGDIVMISEPPDITARAVRITSLEEGDLDWIEVEAEDAPIQTTAVTPPPGSGGTNSGTITTPTPVNLPIIFAALIGGLLQIWCLLSWPAPGRGCNVWISWTNDGTDWEQAGTCTTPSPTGHLIQDMARLRVQPGLRSRPGLRVGVADFAMCDLSESGVMPPFPAWDEWLEGAPGALLWVNGELMAYALEADDGTIASCSMMRRGLYDTALGKHPILSRVGAVTPAAWTMPVPPGREGQTCYIRFPGFGERMEDVATYSVEIPA